MAANERPPFYMLVTNDNDGDPWVSFQQRMTDTISELGMMRDCTHYDVKVYCVDRDTLQCDEIEILIPTEEDCNAETDNT